MQQLVVAGAQADAQDIQIQSGQASKEKQKYQSQKQDTQEKMARERVPGFKWTSRDCPEIRNRNMLKDLKGIKGIPNTISNQLDGHERQKLALLCSRLNPT